MSDVNSPGMSAKGWEMSVLWFTACLWAPSASEVQEQRSTFSLSSSICWKGPWRYSSHEEENICPVTMSNSLPLLFPIWHGACISPSPGYLLGFTCLKGRLGDKKSRFLFLPLPEYSCDLGQTDFCARLK